MAPQLPLARNNPAEPHYLAILRSFVQGTSTTQAESDLTDSVYLALLRAHLLGAQQTLRAARIAEPSKMRGFDRSLAAAIGLALAIDLIYERISPESPERDNTTVRALLHQDPSLKHVAATTSGYYHHRATVIAREASLSISQEVQQAQSKQMGLPPSEQDPAATVEELTKRVLSSADASITSARTGAYNAGVMETQTLPFLSAILPALQVIGSNDVNTRRGRVPIDRGENHLAALGLVAGLNDPIWNTTTPPFGYRCRHFLRSVSVMEAQRKGWLDQDGNVARQEPPNFADYAPHPAFGGKPTTRA